MGNRQRWRVGLVCKNIYFFELSCIFIIMGYKKCEFCGNEFEVTNVNKRKRFCNSSCSAVFNNKKRGELSSEHKKNISIGLRDRTNFSSGDTHSKLVGLVTKGKFKDTEIRSIYELSSRTISKIFKRLNLGCSNCNWNEGTCDIHHINGRKIVDCNNHNNLSLLCPNCHRLAHEKKINKNDLKSLVEILPNDWRNSYYG